MKTLQNKTLDQLLAIYEWKFGVPLMGGTFKGTKAEAIRYVVMGCFFDGTN